MSHTKLNGELRFAPLYRLKDVHKVRESKLAHPHRRAFQTRVGRAMDIENLVSLGNERKLRKLCLLNVLAGNLEQNF
jgi:hypothetical protein